MFIILCLLFILFANCLFAQPYYVSPTGNDTYPGTVDSSFKTITKAVSKAIAGDTIFVRGGIHTYTTRITILKNGTNDSMYSLFAFPGERPVLDFSGMVLGTSNQGIQLKGSYWHIKGIDIKGAGDNGLLIEGGKNNIIENCAFYENRDSGCQLKSGAAYNQILNCDSYCNADPTNENADGFAPKLTVGIGNYFYGCRAWQNLDDGWDGYLDTINFYHPTTVIENCWSFMNGYRKDGTSTAPNGDGNGFKMGGSGNKKMLHDFTLKNCLAFDNRVDGFDQNSNRGSMILNNCTSYKNGRNYGMADLAVNTDSGAVMILVNCISAGSGSVSIWNSAVQYTNSWQGFTVSDPDFISLDTSLVLAPRKPDGSLPDITFMHLTRGSQLIDAGTDVGLPYKGTAPDLGCFESDYVSGIADENNAMKITDFQLEQNYPNPFNPITTIEFSVGTYGHISLHVYDILGREIAILVNEEKPPGFYTVQWNASDFPSSVYFYKLTTGKFSQVKKMALAK